MASRAALLIPLLALLFLGASAYHEEDYYDSEAGSDDLAYDGEDSETYESLANYGSLWTSDFDFDFDNNDQDDMGEVVERSVQQRYRSYRLPPGPRVRYTRPAATRPAATRPAAAPASQGATGGTFPEAIKHMNAYRASQGKPALQWDAKLQCAADVHSKDQARRNTMSHTGGDGSGPSQRLTKCGFKWRGVAENVAMGQKTDKDVADAWWKSPGHQKNMLGDFTKVAVSKVGNYWTAMYAK